MCCRFHPTRPRERPESQRSYRARASGIPFAQSAGMNSDLRVVASLGAVQPSCLSLRLLGIVVLAASVGCGVQLEPKGSELEQLRSELRGKFDCVPLTTEAIEALEAAPPELSE